MVELRLKLAGALRHASDIGVVAGCGLVVAGVAMVCVPAAFVVAGLFVAGVAVLLDGEA